MDRARPCAHHLRQGSMQPTSMASGTRTLHLPIPGARTISLQASRYLTLPCLVDATARLPTRRVLHIPGSSSAGRHFVPADPYVLSAYPRKGQTPRGRACTLVPPLSAIWSSGLLVDLFQIICWVTSLAPSPPFTKTGPSDTSHSLFVVSRS